MRAFMVAGFFFALGTVAAAEPGDWIPDKASVAAVDAIVVMPKGTGSSKAYTRLYTGIQASPERVRQTASDLDTSLLKTGDKIIWGEYIAPLGLQPRPPPGPMRIVPANEMPRMGDGGCAVVNVYYDVQQHRVVGILCNDTG